MALIETPKTTKTCCWRKHQGVTFPLGYKAGATWCGFKSGRKDLALIVSKTEASAAGVFTQNLVKASSVFFSREIVAAGKAKAIYCSSGNANACVGPQGMLATQACADLAAEKLGCNGNHVLVAHTGVIGHAYQIDKAKSGLGHLKLASGNETDKEVAEAILTTDTVPKQLSVSILSPHWEGELRIGGVTKGSGMIAPNMATTLCFLTTDAEIPPPLLQKALTQAMDRSFNRITVDGDTSTNDMALLLANGTAEAKITEEGLAFNDFCEALEEISVQLAQMVVRDGEGATKFVAVTVNGAPTENQAAQAAKTIAESPLVKTALFGNDPNWGRVLAAAGRSGVNFNPDQAKLNFGPHTLFQDGVAASFDKNEVHDYLKQEEIEITLDLGQGDSGATVWTCDYSYDYIRINAEYHT